jgi:cyclic beta-1,2-glucan synthetase
MDNAVLYQFKRNVHSLTKYYKKLIKKTKQNQNVGSINEWIVDNYYIISEQEKHIRSEYFAEEIIRIKRRRKNHIYGLVYSYLKENDLNLSMTNLFAYLNKYQKQREDYFSYSEISFIYIAARMIFISELCELAKKLEVRLNEKEEVEGLFKEISNNLHRDPSLDLSNFIEIDDRIIDHPFYIEQLNYKLKELGKLSEKAFIKLNELLLKNEISLKEIIKKSHDDKARDNFLMINLFTSLKKIVKYKMEYVYKNISYTEKLLISEDANIFDQMYDNNKMDYRSKIIKLAKKKKITEYELTLSLIEKANKSKKHVGWFLFKDRDYDFRAQLYIAAVILLTIVLSVYIANYMGLGILFILLIPISGSVIEIINQILMHFIRVKSLFKLKFEEGLPKEYSTMVVIPTLIKDKNKVNLMFERLETYYLSNKTDNLYFTLLGDASGEKTKTVEKDMEIAEAGIKKINELNEKYGKKIFYFVHRSRFYNEGEGHYLGFERKRGALMHFNALLLGKLSASQKEKYFNCHTFDDFNIPIKYVITLDADTKLVLNTALKMVGAMAHPLNRPILSKDKKRVVSGYGIMQPRINIDVEVTNKSQYSQLFAGLGGLDIYTTASFDLYQDVFDEGSFVGKGIYDLNVFEQVLHNTFPNNLVLSHDLIEGNYLRCGFINDVELFDDYPANYLSDANRHHRWNRGDWQIISWLGKKVRNEKDKLVNNPITLLAKWKIFDNLRRGLMRIFLLLILFYGFTFGQGETIYYLVLVLIIIAIPIFFYIISKIFYRNKYDVFLKYYLNLLRGLIAIVTKSFIVLSLLPFEARLYTDSIIRALYRMYISKKNLLNWITAEEIEKTLKNDLKTYFINFKPNYIAATLLIICSLFFRPDHILVASLIAGIWLFAPFLMYTISKGIPSDKKALDEKEKQELKEIAYQTWQYFEDLILEEYNYLVPDNYQLNREKKVDYKTSPTNIGYSLLSIVSAAELEIISDKKAVNLISNIIKSVERLEKWNGHLYNWYDISTCKQLYPYFISSVDNGNFIATLYVVKGYLIKHGSQDILSRVVKLIDEMDFTKLYNHDLDVFSIGYNGSDQTLLTYHYNNFASEARLTSFIAIAKGDAPYKHWFCLDKSLTKYKYYKGVASWAGSSFEYFMPLIFMKTYKHTLLDETYYFAYYAQKGFIREINHHLPWGISESAYNELDDSQNYKYGAFGIPYLKLQDNPSYPIIISPYSSIMAISIDDREVYNNIQRLKRFGMYGQYGFYESYDHEDKVIIKNYHAHHQGMILASLTNYLKNNIIQDYFHSDKRIQSIEMLLKEKVQIKTYIDLKIAKYKRHQYSKEVQENDVREYDVLSDIPEIGVLSNGFYSTLINDRGIGFSKYKNLQINRYREIATEDYGIFFYIRNLNTGKLWSNTYAPLNNKLGKYKVTFASDRIKYVREDDGIVTNTEITVVKDHNAEIRKLTFLNNTNDDVVLEVTSFGEVIMARNEEDIAHRAFNSLMIHSEVDEETSSLIFSRRSRTKENTIYFIINRMFLDKDNEAAFEYETSRAKFIGRNKSVSNPELIINKKRLSKTVGASLDPIMSIRRKIRVKARSKTRIYLLVGFGKSKDQVLEIAKTYKDEFSVDSAFDMTTVLNNMRTSYANLTAHQMRLYNAMLKYIYQSLPMSEQRKEILQQNSLAQPNLWKFGISGEWPIIMIEIDRIEDAGFVREVLQAYEFYKSRAIYIDVVIINNEDAEKEKMISDYIDGLMYRINNLNYFENSPGGVYIISVADISGEEKTLLNTVAEISLNASTFRSLEDQIYNLTSQIPRIEKLMIDGSTANSKMNLPQEIEFYNNYGGFVNQGKEYLIDKLDTPAPWVNVIANETFGTIVSNNHGGFTYAYNSREFKLTSWSNDIIGDPSSESIIINNTILKPSLIKHGFGYTTFYSSTKEYDAFIRVFIGHKTNIKFYELNITNKLNSKQSLRLDFLVRTVLGVSEELSYRYIISDFDEKNNCLKIRNVYNNIYGDVNVFVSSTEKISEYNDKDKINKAITVNVDLYENESKTLTFMLGCERNTNILDKYRNNEAISKEFDIVTDYWKNKLSVINVNTPDVSLNYVLNGWYLYQAYTSRLLARAGFYQVGGAIGFRDQLQDVMSLFYSDPLYAKRQILKHAMHQFKEGDVLHWWHEDLKIGSRTKFTDDYLWLIYVTYEYLKVTGDYKILDENVCFVEGEKLKDSESEKGISYTYSEEKDTLYNHLKLCISKALRQHGKHNLPLMGSGDWNDGMNRVGHRGRGESVFVGFFLHDILYRMAEITKKYNKDHKYVSMCYDMREKLKDALNNNAWDGTWYLRAYFDNGVPLGSRNNRECQIDLLSQAWSVLSEVADEARQNLLFNEVENRLVDRENNIIKLLTPPFKSTRNNPGYIKDYPTGVRENGAQYTHAALWYIMALLNANKIDLAYEYYQMINPINRTLTDKDIMKYKVEPYAIAADIYSNPGHLGRGGWTWYTGSASWAYKIALEEILGFKKEGDTLTINPKIPSSWDSYEITYQYKDTKYLIKVNNKNHISSGRVDITVNGIKARNNIIKLRNDKQEHKVIVNMKEDA